MTARLMAIHTPGGNGNNSVGSKRAMMSLIGVPGGLLTV